MPLQISVITAVRNRVDTIGSALSSVQGQCWPEIDHVVIDGASTDGTLEILNQHRESISQLVSEPDKGLYDALNKGVARARGDVVGFLHADDEYAGADSLSKVAQAFEDPSVDAVYGDLVYVRRTRPDSVVRYWRAGNYSRSQLALGWMPPHPTFYVRKSVYRRFGAFDTRYRIAADYDSMLRILWDGRVRAAYIPEVLVRMRLGGMSNRSIGAMFDKSREDLSALRRNGVGGLPAVLLKNMSKIPQFMLRAPA